MPNTTFPTFESHFFGDTVLLFSIASQFITNKFGYCGLLMKLIQYDRHPMEKGKLAPEERPDVATPPGAPSKTFKTNAFRWDKSAPSWTSNLMPST